jgi:hypothetical protein
MPEWQSEILRRLAPLKLSPARESEIAEEIAQHLEDRYQELLATGQPESAAFRTAIDELKGADFLARSLPVVERDLYREPVGLGKGSSNSFVGILQDIHYTFRMLRGRCGPHPRSRNWRKYRHFFRCECGPPPAAALPAGTHSWQGLPGSYCSFPARSCWRLC